MKNRHETIRPSKIGISFYGGVEGLVTGSCYRVNYKDLRTCIDLGLFQGRHEERSGRGVRRNFTPMGKIIREVTDVLISHPHIDHIGRLPMIYKDGFTPNIYH